MATTKSVQITTASKNQIQRADRLIIETLNIWDSQIPESTKRAYRFDVNQFIEYCKERSLAPDQIDAQFAREYVAFLASQYKPTTVARKVAAIRSQLTAFFQDQNISKKNPFDSKAVKDGVKSAKRRAAKAGSAKDKAKALQYDDMIHLFKTIEHSTRTIDHRDRVMLMLGFLGGFRRSELANLTWSDFEVTNDGFKLRIKISKTNQAGNDEYKHFFHSNKTVSIPALMEIWKFVVGDKSEYIFPSVNKSGRILATPLGEKGINRTVQKHFGKDFSGHSLRRGFITESFERGASLVEIVHQTGQSPVTVQRDYLNQLDKGKHNAARLF